MEGKRTSDYETKISGLYLTTPFTRFSLGTSRNNRRWTIRHKGMDPWLDAGAVGADKQTQLQMSIAFHKVFLKSPLKSRVTKK